MKTRSYILLGVLAALIGIFLVIPGLAVIPMGFNGARSLRFPPETWSLQWYENFFTNRAWIRSLTASVLVSTLAAVVATVVGTFAAFALVRHRFPGKTLVAGLLLAPLATPIVILGLGDYALFLEWGITGTPLGFVLAYTVLSIPYVVITVSAALVGVQREFELAAAVCGAGRVSVFTRITLPLLLPGILAGFLFAFVTSFDETVIAIFLSDPGFRTLPVTMYSSMTREVDPTIASASSLIMLMTTAVLGIYLIATRKRKGVSS